MSTSNTLLGNPVVRRQITIPANTTYTSTIKSLLATAGYTGPVTAFVILGTNADGTSRPGLIFAGTPTGATAVAADFTTHGDRWGAGVDVPSVPSERDSDSPVQALDGTPFTAVVRVIS